MDLPAARTLIALVMLNTALSEPAVTAVFALADTVLAVMLMPAMEAVALLCPPAPSSATAAALLLLALKLDVTLRLPAVTVTPGPPDLALPSTRALWLPTRWAMTTLMARDAPERLMAGGSKPALAVALPVTAMVTAPLGCKLPSSSSEPASASPPLPERDASAAVDTSARATFTPALRAAASTPAAMLLAVDLAV